MYKVNLVSDNRIRRKLRVRGKITGTGETPRLTVFRSLRHVYAQLIDDVSGKTLVEAHSAEAKGKKSEVAFKVGKILAEKAKEKKIKKAVFDRNGYRYHGRVKSLADGAREGGLVF
ncbi:MAG: 50S ribosomal protein L18 [uncultured bacterium]|nr:MAG: 50S ribosomal protein L18 [uncultured bacterium]